MRVLLLLFLTGVILCQVAFGDHHKDHHDHKDNHQKKGGHHGHKHHHHRHHHSNETLACHKIAYSNADFSFKLFRQIALDHQSENIVISPLSISTSLALLLLGAKFKTHDQIVEGLSLNSSTFSEKDVHESFHHLLEVLNDEDNEFQLNIGNALFIQEDRKIQQQFLDDAKKLYHSETFSTDFHKSEEAKKQINEYVSKNTNGKIPELLSSVSQDAALILINYIYFRGEWENPFNSQSTSDGDFHVSENETVKVPFMRKTGYFNVAFNEDNTVISLPYKGNASALFILPKVGKLKQTEENFNLHSLKKWKKKLRKQFAELSIPKFSFSGSIDLNDVLSKFGIVDLFTDSADLSGITGEPNLKISKALHKAVLCVDEKGTEAAGSTALEAVPMMLPPSITLDSSFIVSLYNHITKSVLFTARVANPAK